MYPIIMAGGSGTRLWPVSRKNSPKQIRPFINDDTLLQKTYKRLLGGFGAEKIYITTNQRLKKSIIEQLPSFLEGNFSIEPCRRGTASALGLALVKILHRDKDATFVYINSDSYIKDEQGFLRTLKSSEEVINKSPDKIVLIGICPEYPETGYGYIKIGRLVDVNLFEVDKFVEKPELETAKEFVQSGKYLWNPTLIVDRVNHFLNLYQKHLPETHNRLMKIKEFIDTPQEKQIIEQEFSFTTDTSIDYGILEKEDKMLVIPANIGWSDVGHWKAIKDILSDKEGENIIKGKHVGVDSNNNLIYASDKKIVGTIGLENMIVVETDDALLVCPKDRAQDVKKIVAEIKEKKLEEYL